jgi:hypothetical protein
MRGRSALVIALLLLAPSWALAQGSITGVVRDSSGSVLPGVTVEASSDALIEKVRTAVTDGNGQYRIVDLRSGTYVRRLARSILTRAAPRSSLRTKGSASKGRLSPGQ